MTVAVDAAGDEFLARAALAGDHDRDIARGDLANDLEDFLHHAGAADDAFLVLVGIQHGLHPASRADARLRLQRALDEPEQFRRVERLHHIIVSAELHRLDRGLRGGVGGHENHQLPWIGRADVLQRLEARQAVHAVVEQHHVGRLPLDSCHALVAARGFLHRITLRRQHAVERIAHLGVVIDDEDRGTGSGGGHGWENE